MNHCQSKFLLSVVLLGAAACSVPAQQTIIFSKPADMSADKANAFLPGATHRAGDYNAPHALFNDFTPDFPLPKPVFQNNNNASVQEALEKRKNWTLLTPEQILGIETPAQVLGVLDKTGEKKLSLTEQFLLRESQESARTATNGRPANAALPGDWSDRNPFENKDQNDAFNPSRHEPPKLEPGTRYFNKLPEAQDSAGESEQKNSSPWNSVFAQPSRPKQTPEQLADMERFRALMEPPATPAPAVNADVPTRFSTTRVQPPAPNPFLEPVPVMNPAGRGVQPLEKIFSHPMGIKPLPPISTPPPATTTKKASWEAQSPPWIQNTPQVPRSVNQPF
jgi:hypothetical protein